MKTIGFVNSHKENERRIALLPKDMRGMEDIAPHLFFENGYGSALGVSDQEYAGRGARVAARHDILQSCDIICDPKAGDAEYLCELPEGRTIFGWVHPRVDRAVRQLLLEKRFQVYAWEEMLDNGMQVFYRNNELAGEAAVYHAVQCYGALPQGMAAAVLGRGNTAQGAVRALVRLGAEVTVYGRKQEAKFRSDIGRYDILVNAVLWDPKRKDHIIDKALLCRAKPMALLIDVSCDEGGAVETCVPTTCENPIYIAEGVVHYCVDHTPSLYFRTASGFISEQVKRFIRPLVTQTEDALLESCCVMRDGRMLLAESCR